MAEQLISRSMVVKKWWKRWHAVALATVRFIQFDGDSLHRSPLQNQSTPILNDFGWQILGTQ